ncbi:MAG: hypothetical protein QXX79_04000, partial [Candidatus Bathyarchaeia archaeon]
ESLGGVPGEGLTTDVQIFQSMLFVQYYIVERLVYYVWIAALFSIAVHAMFALPWMRSVSIAISSVIPSVVMFRLLSYGMIWL